MRAIGYILLSFLQQRFLGVLNLALGLLFFIGANIATFVIGEYVEGGENDYFDAFLVAAILVCIDIAMHLKQLVISPTYSLYPRSREYLLVVTLIMASIFIIWPCVAMAIIGFPFLKAAAMFIMVFACVLWLAFVFGDNIIAVVAGIWILRSSYELLGFNTSEMLFSFLSGPFFKNLIDIFPVLLLIISIIGSLLFLIYFHKVPGFGLSIGDKGNDPYLKGHDNAGPVTSKLAMRAIVRLLNFEKMKNSINISRIKLIQFSLFNPGTIVVTQTLFIFTGLILYFTTYEKVFLPDLKVGFHHAMLVVLLIYSISAGMLSTDFLQHRYNLPRLWIQADFASRREFAFSILRTYLFVGMKQVLLVTLSVVLLLAFTGYLRIPEIIPTIAAGLLFFLFHIGISIFYSEDIKSANCKEWTIINMTTYILLLVTLAVSEFYFMNNLQSWIILGSMFALGIIILWRSTVRFSDFNIDYPIPDYF